MRYRAMTVVAILCSAIPFAFAKSPCDTLTAAEASAVLGATTQAPKFVGMGCIYSVSSSEDFSVLVMDGLGAMAERSYEEAVADKSAKHTAVAGLGEKADFELSEGNHAIIHILSKNRLVILEARGGKKDGLQDAMIQAAKKVLSRL